MHGRKRFIPHWEGSIIGETFKNDSDREGLFFTASRVHGWPVATLWTQNGSSQSDFPEGDRSWGKVKNEYYHALTSTDENERRRLFATTFFGLGFQLHNLQEAAVPPHVRNRGHGIE
jgi:hypothetical protein